LEQTSRHEAALEPMTSGRETSVAVSNLRKSYGSKIAVDGISFHVEEGEIFGILGPNGAGKSTAVECLTGLRTADSGEIAIFGVDPDKDPALIRAFVGIQLQESRLPPKLKVRELLNLFASFYSHPADQALLVSALSLNGTLATHYRSLSGGQQQRLSVALALIGRPRVAVLDEMTASLDPEGRRDAWELIEKFRDDGTTVLLVTHGMDEAERLCNRVALMDGGRIIATGTPGELAASVAGGQRVRFTPSRSFDDKILLERPDVSAVHHDRERVEVRGSGNLISTVILTMDRAGITANEVELAKPNLEDAYLALTGHDLHTKDEA
jgi:ABC-2 type transport system ATP-binding protein